MRPAPTRCPICESELEVVRLHCPSCDTSIEGHFASGHFANLTPEQMEFIFTFVRVKARSTVWRMKSTFLPDHPKSPARGHPCFGI